MTQSEIYREAAERLALNIIPGGWSCWAIEDVLKVRFSDGQSKKHPIVKKYEAFFSPRNPMHKHAWGLNWDMHERDNCRILALCFMAAITERP